MRYINIILLAILIVGCADDKSQTKAKNESSSVRFEKLTQLMDHFAEEIVAKGNANSFALAIYKDGEIYQNYYGEIDRGLNNKPNDSSLYEIASITKTFTGSLVAKAVVEGKLSLDDDLRDFLPGEYPNLEFEGEPIRIRHLLTHSLGLKLKTPPRLEAFNEQMNSGESIEGVELYSIDDLLEELKSVELDKLPGTVFVYNSVGPELLAYILEQTNNQPFKQQVNTFLTEIGMYNTYLQESPLQRRYLVQGYEGTEPAVMDYCPIYGAAGGAISTLPDMAIYMRYLVDNKEATWVKEASRVLFTDVEDDENIGYLWQNIGFAEEEGYYYSKTGTSNGVQSGVLICPDSNYGIVLMVNNTSEKAYDDWETLFFRDIEPDLIKYPKLNLVSILKMEFNQDQNMAFQNFRTLKNDTVNYHYSLRNLNYYGYQLLNEGNNEEAIGLFKFLTEEFPQEANTFDSLGEAYFVAEDYENALINYRRSLELDPENENAKTFIKEIEVKRSKTNE